MQMLSDSAAAKEKKQGHADSDNDTSRIDSV
jgi:hypothetical protein